MSAWPPSLVNQSVHPAKCRANCFWDKKVEKCLTRGLRGERGGGGEGYAFPFTARILYPRLRCKTLYINRNGFRLAWSGFEVERLFHAQNEVSQRFGFGHGKRLPTFSRLKIFFFWPSNPSLNSLKAAALLAVRRLISPTHLQKL